MPFRIITMKKSFIIFSLLINASIFPQENQYFSNSGALTFETDDYTFNIILVPDLLEALERWNNPDRNGYSYIVSISAVRIDEPMAILIIFTPKKENINLTYNFSMLKSNGTFSENKYDGLIIYNGRARKNIALHGRDLLTIVYRNEDPLGKYQYHLEIFDSENYLGKAVLEFEVRAK
jgi:hypothetical protein